MITAHRGTENTSHTHAIRGRSEDTAFRCSKRKAIVMQVFKNIWRDIRRGESIDLYAAVAVAIPVAILNLLGITRPSITSAITLTILALLASAALVGRHKNEQILEKLSELSSKTSIGARIYKHWLAKDVQDVIGYAKRSITIIDSWFGEAAFLAAYIAREERSLGVKLKVNVYMLDPDLPFGAQRRAEFDGNCDGTSQEWREKYRSRFIDSVETLRRHLSNIDNLELCIYKYRTMPEIRMYVVDDREFIFSWFPVNGPSAENVCFHLSSTTASEGTFRAIERLRLQMNGIHMNSQVIN